MSSSASVTPWTICWPASSRHSTLSAGSSPTRPTSCARRSPWNGRCSRWRWPTPMPPRRACARRARNCWPVGVSTNACSNRCSPWPPANAAVNHREPIDLARVAGHVLLTPRPDIQRQGLELDTTLEPATVAGDPALIERLMANLVDNAVRYNHPGGRIEVRTAAVNGHAVVSVSQHRPRRASGRDRSAVRALPAARWRPAAGADGHHGLGLSIVRAIALAHDATIDAVPEPEGGLAVTVSFARLGGARVTTRNRCGACRGRVSRFCRPGQRCAWTAPRRTPRPGVSGSSGGIVAPVACASSSGCRLGSSHALSGTSATVGSATWSSASDCVRAAAGFWRAASSRPMTSVQLTSASGMRASRSVIVRLSRR